MYDTIQFADQPVSGFAAQVAIFRGGTGQMFMITSSSCAVRYV
jgi:hypothetical protein